MKHTLQFVVFLICISWSNSLKAQTKIFSCPFANGTMLVRDVKKPFYGCFPDLSVNVVSTEKEIHAVSDGVVSGVAEVGGMRYLVIQSNEYYVALGPFDSCFVQKNDTIKRGQKISISNMGKIEITVSKGLNSIENPERLFDCACMTEDEYVLAHLGNN